MQRPLIDWNEKDKMIDTEHGRVTYERFCENEVKRRKDGTKVMRKGNLVCVN